MQPVYNSYVTKEIARKLLSLKFPLHKYGIGNYDGKPSFTAVGEDDPMWADSDRFKIPTYAEVLDMLYEKGFVVSIKPRDSEGSLRFYFEVYRTNTEGKSNLMASGITGSANSTLKETLNVAIEQIMFVLGEQNQR